MPLFLRGISQTRSPSQAANYLCTLPPLYAFEQQLEMKDMIRYNEELLM